MRDSPSLLRSAFAMLLLFVLFAMTTCTALAQPVASPKPFGVWATGGGGTLRGADASAWGDVAGLHVQRGATVVERSAVGAMFVGDVSLRKGDAGGVGMGLTMFANANAQRPFAGVQLELVAGRWR